MNNNQHMIFERSECPAHQLLQDYLDGKLSGKEKHLIEKHLVDCEMCSDEIEGLSLLKEKEKLDMIIEEIKIKSLKKQSKILPFIFRYRFAAAAAVFVILAAVVIILQLSTDQKQKPLLAEKSEVIPEVIQQKSEVIPEVISPEAGDHEETSKELSEEKTEVKIPEILTIEPVADAGKEAVAKDDIEEIVSSDVIEIDIESDSEEEVSIPKSSGAKSGAYETKDLGNDKLTEVVLADGVSKNATSRIEVAEINQIPVEADAPLTTLNTQAVSKKGARRSYEPKPRPIDKALEKFNSKKYKSAIKLFEEIISSDSNNYEALYYNALCYYELKNYEKAIVFLGEIISNEGNAYYGKAEKLLMDIKK